MSQIITTAQMQETPVTVRGGWDRPLRTMWLDVTVDGEVIIDTMLENTFQRYTTRELFEVASSKGLICPDQFWDTMHQHEEQQCGNVVVHI